MYAFNLFGDNVHMLSRMQRHRHPTQAAQCFGPLTGTVNHHITGNITLCRFNTNGHTTFNFDPGNLNLFKNLGASGTRSFGQRLGKIGRIRLSITWQPHCT